MGYDAAQRGNTLIVALIMLALMTLVAVTSLTLSTTNVRVVGNMQFQEEATAAAQQAIENVITKSYFDNVKFTDVVPGPQNISMSGEGGDADYTVTFARQCVTYVPVDPLVDELPEDCYASGGAMLCYWGVWEIAATATDDRTGASATVRQGIRILTGQSAALAGCGV